MVDTAMNTLEGKDVTRVSGPAIVGGILNWYLYGILTVQYILYLMYARNDKLVMRIIIHFIFVLDTVQTCFSMDDTFFYFVYGFGDVQRLFDLHWAFDVPTLDAIIGLVVQGVYCWRIWVLSGWRVIPIFSALVALMAGASGFAAGILFRIHSDNPALGTLPSILWLIGSAVADFIIAGSMTWILLKKGSFKTRSTTGDRIMRLLALTLETNAITAALAIASCIIFFIKSIAPPATNFYQLGPFLLGKLYSNCFMVLLNQRHHGSDSKAVTSSYQHGSRTEAAGFSIELGSRTGARANTMDLQSFGQVQVRPPLPPKAQDLAGGGNYSTNVPSSRVKYDGSSSSLV